MKNTDLHTHSYYSDGELSPAELVRLAKKKSIKNLALTDHNSIRGIPEAIKESKKIGIAIIPAVEVVVQDAEILGYFIDYKNPNLKKDLKRASSYGNEKTKRKIRILQKQGFDITYSKFLKELPHSKDNHNAGHLIYYLNKNLKIPREKTLEILNKIDINKPKKKNLTLIQGIRLIKKYGGVPILAHPWINRGKFHEKNIKKWIKIGLKGIELENGEEHNFGRTKKFIGKIKRIANKYNLILTSGSDYHGETLTKLVGGTHKLGKYNCDEKILRKLIEVRKIKAIIFDIGGVMVQGNNMKTHYDPLIKFMKLDKKDFFKSYKKYVHKASRGKISSKKMIYSIAKELNVDKEKLLANWIKYKKKSIKKNLKLEKIIKKLKKKGYIVGSMSGVLDLHYKLCNEKKVYDIFDFNICSFKVKCNKPDIKIYKLLLKKLKLKPKEILFIDDTKECLPPAKKLGMKTILYKNNNQLKKELK